MLKEKDLDIVLIGTPDHWHALPMIAAVEAGADVYVQKPISVDVVEGQAMVAAARKHKRVVQVGTQRRSTPHLIEARDRVLKEGKLGTIGLVEVCCYYHMRATADPDVTKPPEYLDYEMWTGPAPLRPYDAPPNKNAGNERVPHRRWWRTFMEYGNGIMGDMCIHMLDMVRWMLDLGWPRQVASTGGILVQKSGKSNIADTQTATFDFGDLQGGLAASHLGRCARPEVPLGRDLLRRQGNAQGQRQRLRLHAVRQERAGDFRGKAVILDKYPEDKTEKDIEIHVAEANRRAPGAISCGPSLHAASRWPTSSRATSRRRAASWPTCR